MSYILEALRRSQAQRELGRVPTLEGAALVAAGPADAPRRGPWAVAPVVLAAIAVLIALYAALRTPEGPRAAAPGTAAAGQAGAVPVAPAPVPLSPPSIAKRPTAPGVLSAPSAGVGPDSVVGPLADPGDRDPRSAPTAPGIPAAAPRLATTPGAEGSVPVGTLAPGSAGAPLVEAPPPKAQARVAPPVPPTPAVPVPDLAESQPAPPDDPAAQLQLELERQLESDGAVVPDSEPAPLPTLREEPGPTPVPADLIAEIEDFKHQVQGGPGKDKAKEKGAQKAADLPVVPPTPRPPGAPADAGDPATQLRLTHEQEAALPKFVMSVHVYDAQPDRRFVLINGLKYAEGAKTREGLTVERIRVDGAVLMHEGHPFFVHR